MANQAELTVGCLCQNIKATMRKSMRTISKAIIFSVLAIVLAGCGTFAPKPTETPTPTETSVPTSTNTPEPSKTPTSIPSNTPLPPTETPSEPILPMPSGKPSSEWNGIPVMPTALAGEGDNKGYSFTIKASSDEIQKFYEKALAKLGWNMLGSGQGTTHAVLLIFMKDAGALSVSIIPQPDGTMYVLLVK
jgi:hypothetical protein